MKTGTIIAAGAAALFAIPLPATAAELDGAALAPIWALPFVGILLSIALGPLLFAHVWEHHYGKIALAWGILTALPLAVVEGADVAFEALMHTALLEYVPFIALLFALFTCAGGILVRGNLRGSPGINTVILAVGAGLASVIGTTGAAMVLIRPLLRANDDRRHSAHVVVFFIFLVANIGGSLTPLGDPPLFLGFLRGVDFFWTAQHLLPETLLVVAILLGVFFLLDRRLYKREAIGPRLRDPTPESRLGVEGRANFVLIGVIIAAVLASAAWKPGISLELPGATLELQNVLREVVFVLVALASLMLTRRGIRQANGFNWGPIVEVAKLFAAIFACMIPVMAMLRAGSSGAFAPLVNLVTGPTGESVPVAYFWLTGILSSFLDNAPTYLVFFQLAGGDAQHLMREGAPTLAAISAGAVFMGANTYIGNAPNFMVYAIARHRGVKMPSFFGYMLWSGGILIPVFLLVTWLFYL